MSQMLLTISFVPAEVAMVILPIEFLQSEIRLKCNSQTQGLQFKKGIITFITLS